MKPRLKAVVSLVLIGGLLTAGLVYASTTTAGSGNPTPGVPGAPGNFRQGPPPGMRGPGTENNLQTLTTSLVSENIITQETADAILAYQKEKDTERKADMDKVKNMTETERQAYFASKTGTQPSERTDLWQELVTAGTLTQDQATAIQKYSNDQAEAQQQAQVKNQLDTLVKANTITSDQETSIMEAWAQEQTNRKAEMEKVKTMTEAERQAYFDSKSGTQPTEKTSFLSTLVDSGVLTQVQADVVGLILLPGHSRP